MPFWKARKNQVKYLHVNDCKINQNSVFLKASALLRRVEFFILILLFRAFYLFGYAKYLFSCIISLSNIHKNNTNAYKLIVLVLK